MGVLDIAAARTERATTARRTNTVAQEDQVPAEFWINVGYVSKNAEGEDIFISLPFGIPLDTMRKMEPRGQNLDWIARVNASNNLLDTLILAGQKMEPGETKIIGEGQLVIQLRRTKGPAEVAEDVNPYTKDLSDIF